MHIPSFTRTYKNYNKPFKTSVSLRVQLPKIPEKLYVLKVLSLKHSGSRLKWITIIRLMSAINYDRLNINNVTIYNIYYFTMKYITFEYMLL